MERIEVVVAAKTPAAALDHALAFPLIATVLERGDTTARARLAAGVNLRVEVRAAAALRRRPRTARPAPPPTSPAWPRWPRSAASAWTTTAS